MTVLAKLVASLDDGCGYIVRVFERLEDFTEETKYIMCTQFPNWDTKPIKINEVGYLNFVEIRAGLDTWFNGSTMVPYNYNLIQFIKFVPKSEDNNQEYIM